jgi:hypothetical protein
MTLTMSRRETLIWIDAAETNSTMTVARPSRYQYDYRSVVMKSKVSKPENNRDRAKSRMSSLPYRNFLNETLEPRPRGKVAPLAVELFAGCGGLGLRVHFNRVPNNRIRKKR